MEPSPPIWRIWGSFCYVGVIWLNHHAAFIRVGHVDAWLHFANSCLLFTTALIPFPTAVVSRTLVEGIDGRCAHGGCVLCTCRNGDVCQLAAVVRAGASSSRQPRRTRG
ncbi:TMEM175 family protein [Mycolicibacterium hodleri]|uniref:DUF1211 domain-containing protein n=1 Tax=Mycolicibacterium hodleri TaxID=49897 RepID=A0A502E7Y6_9MYCO|nr:DUF1211 domain-containing protein [Mycolicibacterium hodleri]